MYCFQTFTGCHKTGFSELFWPIVNQTHHACHLCIVFDCFCTTMVELSGCEKNCVAHKDKNIYCLSLYRKSVPIFAIENKLSNLNITALPHKTVTRFRHNHLPETTKMSDKTDEKIVFKALNIRQEKIRNKCNEPCAVAI